MERTVASLCELLQGELIGPGSTMIRGVNVLDLVKPEEITFADNPKRLIQALATDAAAIIVPKDTRDLHGRTGIRVDNPKLAFALLLELFSRSSVEGGVHPTAVVGNNVRFGEDVSVQAHAVIGENVVIGRQTSIGAGVYIGADTLIGEQCTLDANVVIYRRTQLGNRVQIHAGSVIGGDGFGYVFDKTSYVKIPQVGNVVIEDDVEIGCNVCVDRATMGSTLIRQGTKIDNLVQIAHNNRIGQHVIITGEGGLSGSVTVGDYAVLGGRVGVTDHVTIGEHAQIGLCSVVTKDVPPHATVWGYPARPIRAAKRQLAALARLPALLKDMRKLLRDAAS